MRRLVVGVIGIVALTLLIACGGGGTNATKTTPSGTLASQTPAVQATQQEVTPAVPFAQACQKTGEKSFASAPPRVIDRSKTYIATITTAKGNIVVQLFSDTPITTNNFVFLACKGFYDGLSFHRVVAGFVAQGGDPQGNCRGGPGYSIPDEANAGHKMEAGAISMAKAGPNTAGSQFFITYTAQPQLESGFTVFGKLTSGMDALKQLTPHECGQGALPTENTIESITIHEQ